MLRVICRKVFAVQGIGHSLAAGQQDTDGLAGLQHQVGSLYRHQHVLNHVVLGENIAVAGLGRAVDDRLVSAIRGFYLHPEFTDDQRILGMVVLDGEIVRLGVDEKQCGHRARIFAALDYLLVTLLETPQIVCGIPVDTGQVIVIVHFADGCLLHKDIAEYSRLISGRRDCGVVAADILCHLGSGVFKGRRRAVGFTDEFAAVGGIDSAAALVEGGTVSFRIIRITKRQSLRIVRDIIDLDVEVADPVQLFVGGVVRHGQVRSPVVGDFGLVIDDAVFHIHAEAGAGHAALFKDGGAFPIHRHRIVGHINADSGAAAEGLEVQDGVGIIVQVDIAGAAFCQGVALDDDVVLEVQPGVRAANAQRAALAGDVVFHVAVFDGG